VENKPLRPGPKGVKFRALKKGVEKTAREGGESAPRCPGKKN